MGLVDLKLFGSVKFKPMNAKRRRPLFKLDKKSMLFSVQGGYLVFISCRDHTPHMVNFLVM